MIDAATAPSLPSKRPRSGPGTWPRHYCDPASSPKHAKGRPSPRTSPERAPRSQRLDVAVVEEIAAVLAPHARNQEPAHVVADVLLRLLPMPDCARSTVAIVVHRRGNGACDDLTYHQAGSLGGCHRRTAIQRFARTEGYGFIRVEQRDYAYGGAAPNVVTATIPPWVYEQIDACLVAVSTPQPHETPSFSSAERGAHEAGTEAANAPVVPTSDVAPSEASQAPREPAAPAMVLSPEDAAIDARLEEIFAFTRQRFSVASVRGLNAKAPAFLKGGGVPRLDDEQILVALDEYIHKQRPLFERKAKYRERMPARQWVERGIHVYLWNKRRRLDGIDAKPSRRDRKKRGSAPTRPTPVAAALLRLGAELEPATAVVRSVSAGSIAARLLFQGGDRLVRIDGRPVATAADVRAALGEMTPGVHTFEVVRAQEVVTATVAIEARGPPEP